MSISTMMFIFSHKV